MRGNAKFHCQMPLAGSNKCTVGAPTRARRCAGDQDVRGLSSNRQRKAYRAWTREKAC